MKKTSLKFLTLIKTLVLFGFATCFAQNESEKAIILQSTNLGDLRKIEQELISSTSVTNQKIQQLALEKGWKLKKLNADGSFDELVGILPDGSPLYYAIENTNAAKSTRANHLNTGGSLNLNLNGEGLTVGVWDGGPTRISHQEFVNRVTIGDNATTLNGNSFHATHVTGTVGASGVNPAAKGMAPSINVKTFDWTDDIVEVVQEVQNGMLLSNHSYGTPLNSITTPWYIGAYSQPSRAWDEIAYAAPYYLMVVSAGNDGNEENPSPSTFDYDKLNGNKTAKNNLVIANAQDANVDINGNLISVAINSGSSQGPTDDFRIKPDITGNGTSVFSTNSSSNTSYTTLSGTSMSGPNVMGTLALLQQYYNQINGKFMRAATLKGLACHTADDAGRPGPDANFGWGLLNAKVAANTITSNGLTAWISEEELSQNQTFSMNVQSVVGVPLIASIAWTDVPGVANTGVLNDSTPVLVNDLDIRVTQTGTTFFPWRLQANADLNAVRDSDNNVDNVELVKIDNPNGGIYTITISHKGTLVMGPQNYSLVITGMTSGFAIIPVGQDKTVCSNQTAVFDFNFNYLSGSAVTFSAINQPAGSTVVFSSNNLAASSTVAMTVSNLQNVAPGEYTIGIVGTNGTETETRNVKLKVYNTLFAPILQQLPSNGQTGVATSTSLQWNAEVNAESYLVRIATDPQFQNVIQTINTFENSLVVSSLAETSVYYWQVIPSNFCGMSTQTNFFSFQTGAINCGLTFTASDFTNAMIGSTPNSVATVPVIIPSNFSINKVTAAIAINHTWVQDMTIYLESPTDTVILLEEPCGGEDDINATLDDEGLEIVCGTDPAISGSIIPFESLSTFNNLNALGTWTLRVIDNYSQDGGSIDSVVLNFCSISAIPNALTLINNTILTTTNSTKIILPTELNAQTELQANSNQVYTLVQNTSLGELKKENVTLSVGATFTQNDINQNKISYTNTLLNAATDTFKVNVLNAADGWLPNQTATISIQSQLNAAEVDLSKIAVYPNPTNGILTVKLPSVAAATGNLSLVDMQGRKIFSKQMTGSEEILSLEHLSNGIYLLTISVDNQKITKKIVLDR
jgi:subtilisin-like proprotein convertase family protein